MTRFFFPSRVPLPGRIRLPGRAWAGIVLIGIGLAHTAGAATRYVSTNGASSTPPYDTWAKAATNIQNAVFAATNDVVMVTNGLYTCASSLSGTYRAMIIITNSVTLQSVNGPAVTIVDGGNTGEFTNRCFYINNANAVVSGFTITNGRANAANPNNAGGGVYIGGFGTVTNCVITGNSTSNSPVSWGGGGVYMNGGIVKNSVIAGNTGTNGGGGVYATASSLIQDCTISNNRAVNSPIIWAGGGGLYLAGGTAVNCTITMNCLFGGGSGGGGGVWVYGTGCVLSNCIVSFNTNSCSYYGGGGVAMRRGLVTHCDIFGNKGPQGSGFFEQEDGPSVIQNSSISNNTYQDGCSLYFRGGGTARNCVIINNPAGGMSLGRGYTPLWFENCTVVGNSGVGVNCWQFGPGGPAYIANLISYSNSGGNWSTNAADFSFSNCCTTPTNNLPGTGNITNDPMFADISAGNYRLTNNSPCINTGTNQDWMTGATDLDGRPRIDHFQCQWIVDMGAYEFFPSGTMVSFH